MAKMKCSRAVRGKELARDPVNPGCLAMVAVVTQFIPDEKKDEQGTGHGKSQSRYINKGGEFVSENAAQRDFEVVTDHLAFDLLIVNFINCSWLQKIQDLKIEVVIPILTFPLG